MTPINLIFQPNHKTERPIVVVDGLNLFIRMFCARPDTTTSGEPVGGVVGFLKYLNYLTNNFIPKKIIVVWEQGGPSPRRVKIYKDYKANRTKDKETFKEINKEQNKRAWILDDLENRIKQLHLLTQAIKNLPVCQIYVSDCECDDIITYLLKHKFANDNSRKIIVSSDKDFYQLLENPSIEIYDPIKKTLISAEKILSEYNISPRNFCLARTMVGDKSDNIPGINGIGLKTVAKRFPDFGDLQKDLQLQNLIEFCEKKINEKSKIKIYAEVLRSRELIQKNWQLMYLDSSALSASQIDKINYSIDNFKPSMNKLGLIRTMIEAGVVTDIDYDKMSLLFKTMLVE